MVTAGSLCGQTRGAVKTVAQSLIQQTAYKCFVVVISVSLLNSANSLCYVIRIVLRRCVMETVVVRKQGNSIGITLPAETRIRLGLEVGQELTLVEMADGIKLVKRNLKLERQMQMARETLREQADALQELAKR